MMKFYTFCLALLCIAPTFAHAKAPTPDCKKLVQDAARVYAYTSACTKQKAVTNIFNNKQNRQAATKLFNQVEKRCGGEKAISAEAQRLYAQDAQLRKELQNNNQASAKFCRSKVSTLKNILNAYK